MVTIKEITKISQVTPEVTLFLRKIGLTNYYIIKIFNLVGEAAIGLTEDDPYWLLSEFPNMGFKKVDIIAKVLGVEQEDENRLMAGLRYVLSWYISSGHTFAKEDEFFETSSRVLEVSYELIRDALETLTFNGDIHLSMVDGEPVIYFYNYYQAECKLASRLKEIDEPDKGLKAIFREPLGLIKKFENTKNISLSEYQKQAILFATRSGVSIITGGPGTGKTTIIEAIVSIFEESGFKVSLAAPTGRAAKRIMETGGKYAQTIHRLLEYYFDEVSKTMVFGRNSEDPLDADVIIVDEASMLDLILAKHLCEAIKDGSRLILVGDADQLPSVGAGSVLRDLIRSDYFHTSKLNEIYRQSQESNIVLNAHRINRGEYPVYEGDFHLISLNRQEEINKKVAEIAKTFDLNQVQVLTPVKKGIIGSVELNKVLQDAFNPQGEGEKRKAELIEGGHVFRTGDRVMQIQNNYGLEYKCFVDTALAKATNPLESFSKSDKQATEPIRKGKGVFNGEVGIIEGVDEKNHTITVLYDEERWVEYNSLTLSELELAYAVTVHKSQGCEFDKVIIPVSWFPPVIATRSLIYTAITRGKKEVYIVGDSKYLNEMVDRDKSSFRNSGLKEKLMNVYEMESI